jgi:hypothetical protein
MWSYRIDPQGQDIEGELFPAVYIACGNCHTLHDLADTAKNSNPSQTLNS